MGFVRQSTEKFPTLGLTDEGRAFLRERRKVMLTRPVAATAAEKPRIGDVACDEALFERLRQLRKRLADALGVPSYIVFGDVSLRYMARVYPGNEEEFRRIHGVGERKQREFAAPFLEEIGAYLAAHPRQVFADDAFPTATERTPVRPPAGPVRRTRLPDTTLETLRMFRDGKNVLEVAAARGVTTRTVINHLAAVLELGESLDLQAMVPESDRIEITQAFRVLGTGSLAVVRKHLGERHDWETIQLVRAMLIGEQARGRSTQAAGAGDAGDSEDPEEA